MVGEGLAGSGAFGEDLAVPLLDRDAVGTAAEAGAADPETLGRQLAVLFEGANALAASSNDAQAFTDARQAAETLLDVALKTTP